MSQIPLDKLAADESGDQTGSLFHYLFVAAASAAFGTKDRFIPGYRLLRAKEVEVAIRTPDVQPDVVVSTHTDKLEFGTGCILLKRALRITDDCSFSYWQCYKHASKRYKGY